MSTTTTKINTATSYNERFVTMDVIGIQVKLKIDTASQFNVLLRREGSGKLRIQSLA